jgi:cupin fold WbuC family metalloprotein
MLRLDDLSLADLLRQAQTSPRLRSHLLLHSGPDDQVQRLAIALRLGTYVRPHVHSMQWEMLVLLRGSLDVLFFDAGGQMQERIKLAPGCTSVVQIPQGQVHGAVVAMDDTVVIETKPGPYRPNEFMEWAPAENTSEAAAVVKWMATAALATAWSSTLARTA